MSIQIGQYVGGLRVLKKIGEGAMGTVYLAFDNDLQQEVAIKVLHVHLLKEEGVRKRFQVEAIIQATLSHNNFVKVTRLINESNVFGFVMDYVPGKNLSSW